MKPAYTDLKTMHTNIGYHMLGGGTFCACNRQDALANVLVLQQVLLHDPPATGSPCTAQESTARPYKHFYTLDCAKYATPQPGGCRKMRNPCSGRDKHNTESYRKIPNFAPNFSLIYA